MHCVVKKKESASRNLTSPTQRRNETCLVSTENRQARHVGGKDRPQTVVSELHIRVGELQKEERNRARVVANIYIERERYGASGWVAAGVDESGKSRKGDDLQERQGRATGCKRRGKKTVESLV